MILFNSLKEVSDFAHDLIISNSMKDLRKINPETIIDFTIGASTFVTIVTNKFAHKLGYKINGCEVQWIYNEGCTAAYLARCFHLTHYIEYTAKLFLCYPYEEILETIVHEICHCKYLDHSQEYWDYLFQNLKVIGLIPSNTQFQDYFSSNKKHCRSNEILYFTNRTIFPNSNVKYDILKRNKAFDLSNRSFNFRKFSTNYFNYIGELKEYYGGVLKSETGIL